MKLLDILARELKAWPVKEGECNKESDYCVQSDTTSQVFFCGRHGEIFLSERADETSEVRVTRAEWQFAVDALNADKCEHSYANNIGCPECGELNAPKVVEWDGVGLPPVGLVVDTDHKNEELRVKILAYGSHHGGASCVLAADMSHGTEGEMFGWLSDKCSFRPILTAEQVAAEEREKAIADLYFTINWNEGRETWPFISNGRKADYEKAIDSGYTKVAK